MLPGLLQEPLRQQPPELKAAIHVIGGADNILRKFIEITPSPFQHAMVVKRRACLCLDRAMPPRTLRARQTIFWICTRR